MDAGGECMPTVSCSVSECTFWRKGNECNAKQILIKVNERASDAFYAEFASEDFVEERKQMTEISEQTCCHTFQRKTD
jgi:hypothetical protein